MGKQTYISWCDHTFNHVRGCLKVSEACKFCYADRSAKRNPKLLGVFGTEAQGGTRVVASDDMWRQPIRWNEAAALLPKSIVKPYSQPVEYIKVPRPRVFCASLADVFEDWSGPILNHKGLEMAVCHGCGKVDTAMDCIDCGGSHDLCSRIPRRLTMADVRRRLFDLIDETPNLTWQLLTKRPENIRKMLLGSIPKLATALHHERGTPEANIWHRPNCWLGTTVENQEMADIRIAHLLRNRDLAPVTFLSMEPLLERVDLSWWLPLETGRDGKWRYQDKFAEQSRIDWIIVGCESGSHRRETKLEWVRDLREQCKAAGIAFFVKQLEIDGKVTTDINKFPEDLRIQEFPE